MLCHDFRRSWVLSLFGWCSAVQVTGLLAIIDPLFIFHVFCLVFPHTWFQIPQSLVVYLTLWFPPCLCVGLFIVSACARVDWCTTGFCTQYLVIFYAVGFAIKLLRLLPSSALLRLTSLPPVTHPLQACYRAGTL